LLCAFLATKNETYKQIAKTCFDFFLSMIFYSNSIKVTSNKAWLHNNGNPNIKKIEAEQPIDVAYTILALSKFL
jgi:hypothetical protein